MSALGVGILAAPFVVSTCAYFCLGWVVWGWLGDLGVQEHWRTISALLLMFSSIATDTAREGTPDMLCTVLLVGGAWLLLSSRLKYLGVFLLLVSIFGRTDSVVFAGMLLGLAAWRRRVSPVVFALCSLSMLVSETLVARRGYPYLQFVTATLGSSYMYALIHNLVRTELAIYSPFILMGIIALKARYQNGLVLVCLTSWIIRYILLPHFEVR